MVTLESIQIRYNPPILVEKVNNDVPRAKSIWLVDSMMPFIHRLQSTMSYFVCQTTLPEIELAFEQYYHFQLSFCELIKQVLGPQ